MPLFAASMATGVVYSAFAYIDAKGDPLPGTPGAFHRGRVCGPMLVSNFVGFGTSVVKRECFDRLGLFNESLRMGIDYDRWLRFSTRYEFDYIDRVLFYYRDWAGQMSKNWRGRYLNGIEIMEAFLREHPNAVDKRTVDRAWAHTYSGFGYCARGDADGRREALQHYMRALRYKPNYYPAWKGMLATILGR
jgi:hypothetical protein